MSKRRPQKQAKTPPKTGGDPLSAKELAALGKLRQKIDQIDLRLVDLLNERSGLVVKVGKHKRDRGIPIYAPHREAASG